MEKEKILKGQELLQKADGLERSIGSAERAECWDDLLLAFRRADLPDFLGAFDIVRQRFINEVKRKLDLINQEIDIL